MAGWPARVLSDSEGRNDPSVEAAFLAAPSTVIAQILDGELHTMPRPGRRHTKTSSVLGAALWGPFWAGNGGPGGWVILDEPEIHLGPRPDIVVPDLAGWRAGRLPEEVPDEDEQAFYTVAPDWVCEVLSPRTEAVDRGKKMRIYRREGVGHLWLINPMSRTLEVYRLESGKWLLLETYEDDAPVRAEPFDAVELSLGLLW